MASVDHYTTPDNFGPLEGGGEGKYLLWYLYLIMSPQDPQRIATVPRGLVSGTVELPAMTINGQRYESQKLSFKRQYLLGWRPLIARYHSPIRIGGYSLTLDPSPFRGLSGLRRIGQWSEHGIYDWSSAN
jgi:hypothetical protein